jgi:hypothetical protein
VFSVPARGDPPRRRAPPGLKRNCKKPDAGRLLAKLTRMMAMASMDEQILKAAKEIVVKFIETGRLSPTAFPEVFQNIYQTVADTVAANSPPEPLEPEKTEPGKKKKG